MHFQFSGTIWFWKGPAPWYFVTVPEEQWWTYHVEFSNPERQFAFPGMKVYKARWFTR